MPHVYHNFGRSHPRAEGPSRDAERPACTVASGSRGRAAAPGWYTATLPPAWNLRTPSGGVLMTVAMQDPALRPVSANTHFCSPVPAGPLEIRVEVLRQGNVAAQVRAALSSTTVPGPELEVSATCGRAREGVEVLDAEFPPARMPAESTLIVPGRADVRPPCRIR